MLSGGELEPVSSDSSPFRIIFDPHRHRPHFLLVWKDEKKNSEYIDIMAIKPADQQALITCAFELTKVLKLEDLAILSLHQGNFANRSQCSCIHLLVKPNQYLEELQKHNPDPMYFQTLTKRLDQWFGLSVRNNNSYKSKDLGDLHDYIKKSGEHRFPLKHGSYSLLYDLVFHSTQPRIGFKIKDDEQDTMLLFRLIRQFIIDQKISGSHICICLGKTLSVYDQELGGIGVQAYLQVHICDYYRINPDRKGWLERFENKTTFYEQYT